MEFETKPPEDCVDRAGVAPEDNTGGNHILIDNDVVKLRNKVANGDALVSLDPPLRDSIPIHDLGSPSKFRPASTCSKKNTRRRMEDRHVVLHDLKAYLPSHLQSKISQQEHVSFYAVYDGHAGARAAIFAAAHLHEKLVESPDFHTDPVNAIKEAITNTDQLICESAADQSHGATIVLNLIKDRVLYSAWLGDSQSILARNGEYIKLVDPHSPKRWDEKERIQKLGGYVNFWGTWRVNGTLAVSRALGDFALKPYVSSDCDVTTVHLTDLDDFIIVACDGLWDGISPEEGVQMVYDFIKEEKNHDQLDELSSMLSKEAMDKGSTDNITTIVVFLRPLADIRQDCLRERPAMVDPREGIVSTSDFIQNPGTTRDSLDPAQHQPQWASEAASPVTSSQPQITPKHPLVQQFCENSGGGMFSPDPFSTIQQLDTSDQEQFGQTTLEDLRPSPSINSEDSTDYGSTCLDRDSPNKGDSGFISPKKEGGLMSHSSIAAVDQLFKLMNTADQDDDSPPPGEEKSLEEILAERRLIKEDNNIQDESDEDEDEDDDNEDEDVDAVSAVEDDSEDSDDFDKVAVQLSIVEPGDALEVDLSVMTIRDGGYVEDQIEMDPCEQVVVKETHPEESGCLVPPLSTLPTSQEAVLENIGDMSPDRTKLASESDICGVQDPVFPLNGLHNKLNGSVSSEKDESVMVQEVQESVVLFEVQESVQGFMLKTPGEGQQELEPFQPAAEGRTEFPAGLMVPALNIIPSTPTRAMSPDPDADDPEGGMVEERVVVEYHQEQETSLSDPQEASQPIPAPETQPTPALESEPQTTAEPATNPTPEKEPVPAAETNPAADAASSSPAGKPGSPTKKVSKATPTSKEKTKPSKPEEKKAAPKPTTAAVKPASTVPRPTSGRPVSAAAAKPAAAKPAAAPAKPTAAAPAKPTAAKPRQETTSARSMPPTETKVGAAATKPSGVSRVGPAASKPARPGSGAAAKPAAADQKPDQPGEEKSTAAKPAVPSARSKTAPAAAASRPAAAPRPTAAAAARPSSAAAAKPASGATRTSTLATATKPTAARQKGTTAGRTSAEAKPAIGTIPIAAARTSVRPVTAGTSAASTRAPFNTSVISSASSRPATATRSGAGLARSGFSNTSLPSAAASRVAAAREAAKKAAGNTLQKKSKQEKPESPTGASSVDPTVDKDVDLSKGISQANGCPERPENSPATPIEECSPPAESCLPTDTGAATEVSAAESGTPGNEDQT